jgi:hypothetical protein
MPFDPAAYGDKVARLLELAGGGERLMPLAHGACCSPEASDELARLTPRQLFPRSAHPEAAMSGLWLYFSCLDRSHELSQSIASAEGSFWHGIMHRQEPDPGNSAYWFRRVGRHAVFPALAEQARAILAAHPGLSLPIGGGWDPFAFIDFCEQARRQPGSDREKAALEIQRAEWQLLFGHCARAVA